MKVHEQHYVDGRWVRPQAAGVLEVRNAATEEVFATVPAGSAADVDQAVAAARAAFESWAGTPIEERAG